MFACQRCRVEFEHETSLKRHLTRQDIPCDLFCDKCGQYVKSRYIYLKHQTNMCKPSKPVKPSHDKQKIEIEQREIDKITNTDKKPGTMENQMMEPRITENQITENQIMGNELEMNFNETKGIYPLEYDNDIILHTHKKTLNDMLIQSLNRDNAYDIIIQIVRIFYSNQCFLQHSNIIATTPNDVVYKIHNGFEFMDDIMSKTMRNNRVIQIILVHLSEFCEFMDVDKKAKNFVNNVIIPQLVHGYYIGIFHESLNDLWMLNGQYWSKIRKFVPNRYGLLTKEKMMEQIEQYYENEKTMSKMFLSNHTKETSKIIKSIKDKINKIKL